MGDKGGARSHRRRVAEPSANASRQDYQSWERGQQSQERVVAKQLEMYKLQVADRKEAREAFERILKEKLEVVKTAVAMGYKQQELDALDARLEQLIGTEKLKALLDQDIEVPQTSVDLLDHDLQMEIERLQREKANSQKQ